MMHKKILLTLVLTVLTLTTFSQTKKEALRDAKALAKATINQDFNTLLDYSLPSILTLMGGKEKAVANLTSTYKTVNDQGFEYLKAEVIAVSEIVKEQGQYRCYVENLNEMKTQANKMVNKNYLLGIYDTKGKKWWFIEAERLKNNKLKKFVADNFTTSLNIPDDELSVESL